VTIGDPPRSASPRRGGRARVVARGLVVPVAVAGLLVAFRPGPSGSTPIAGPPAQVADAASLTTVCSLAIPPDVVAVARSLRAYVVCRPAQSDQRGHLEAELGRIVIEVRVGRTAADYADTASRLLQKLRDLREGIEA
jgi:hypothetical protein